MSPIQTAVTDLPDEFVVQECLDMRGRPNGPKSQLTFKIRWAGYGPDDDTWEPWACVRDNDAVLTYLYNHPSRQCKKLVPADFVPPDERPDDQVQEAEDDD